MMKINSAFLFTMFIAGLTACSNYVGPDEHGRLCEPGSIMTGSEGCDIPGCDSNQTALFCTADGRGWDCRLNGGVCDTTPDCVGGGVDCTNGLLGACLRHGVTSCPAGSSVPVCNAPTATPVSEVCGNGIDDDCDGVVDDGCSTCVPTGVEICDNLDSDCDGQIDEGCDDDNDDHCDGGMSMGPSGSVHCPRTPPGRTVGDDCDDTNAGRCPSATEICGNGIDEDCNGSDLACGPTCTITNGGVEICDGRDNDCDGFTDEGGVCAVCEDNLGGTLRVQPTAALRATCARGLVTVAWGPGGTELRSIAGATSYSIVMSSSWRGWVRLQAFCPDDASRGSEIGYWAGTVTDWNPRIGNTLRSAGFIVDIDGRDLSDAGYVCREGSSSSFSKPHVPLDECSTFACPL